MFVVKMFASSAIKLGNWSIDWGLDDHTMNTVVAPESSAAVRGAPTPPTIEIAPGSDQGVSVLPKPEQPVPAEPMGRMHTLARDIINFWKVVVAALAAGYQAGFLFVAAVGIYLLLRRDIDGVQLNEVYVDQSDEYGMPLLGEETPSSVPDVAPGSSALPSDSTTIP